MKLSSAIDIILALLDSDGELSPMCNFARPVYRRELCYANLGANTYSMRLEKRGFRSYKRKYPYPKRDPPAVDTEALREYLNHKLAPHIVRSIVDGGREVIITLEEY